MNKRKILLMEPFCASDQEQIRQSATDEFYVKQIDAAISEQELKAELQDAEIVIGQPSPKLLQDPQTSCPKLKLIQMTWAGTDIYTAGELRFPQERISLANASGTYGMIMSQYVIGMILSVMLNFPVYHHQQQNKIWMRKGPIRSLDRAKVLIFGAGNIGTAIAKRLSGFDAYCIGVCRNVKQKRDYFHEFCTLEQAQDYLPDADVVIGCIPNNDQTAGYMNANRLQMMKQNAVIVNVGRGNFIDCMALHEELQNGHLWGAALDVTFPEPLLQEHPLWENSRCMITPHASGTAFGHLKETEDLLRELVCDNLSRYCSGQEIRNRIY